MHKAYTKKKLTTYPRTDARVLTTAITKVYQENIAGLKNIPQLEPFAEHILSGNLYSPSRMNNTKYVDDSKVADHYAIIPTGQETNNLGYVESIRKTSLYANLPTIPFYFLPGSIN